jgi:diguanylate cyclase (GGDEF)-like protein/PAS domain S-box-containing protein
VIEQSPAIVVITNSLGDIEYVNERFVKTTGYQLQDVLGKNPRILKSGETTDEDYLQMWSILSTGGVWSGEFHNKAKDGTLYWERAQISSITDKRGNITHYIAIKEEVTKRKDDEKRLRLASAVFETAAEAIMVSDHNNRIQMINNSFTVITGYESEQVIGQNPSILSSGYHGAEFYQDMYTALDTVGIWEGEVWNRRKNGEIYPQWLTISTMRDEQGVLEGYVSLFSDMTRRKKDEEYIIQQANFDTLTGLPNRNLFSDRLSQSVARAQRSHISSALLFIDLDRFKYVNDTLGHLAGDELLKQAAHRLESCLRAEDTAARLGGDEFAVILLDVHSSVDAQRVVKKILLELSEPYYLGEHEAFISGSIGITLFPDDGDKPELLIRNADSAMYKAKEAGRNDFYFFTPQMNDEALKRRDLEMSLYLALEREQFLLHYQPIVDINTGDIVSAEALIRWNHPTLGIVSPADFIQLAEEIGLIKSIGEWVLRKACNEAVKWQTLSAVAPKVSVNVSSRQFQRQDMAQLVKDVLTETGLAPNLLTLEITESLLVSDVQTVTKQLSDIAALGVSIAIDDFGTGYSSLSYLKKFPISILKIDRSFIGDLLVHEGDQTLVNGIISLANSLGLKVVAEGVEEEAQHTILKMLECDYVQGYYFHYPLTEKLFRKLLQSHAKTLIQ